MAELQNYIKPELLVLAAVLYILGLMLKDTKKVKDTYIPVILGLIGCVLSLGYVLGVSGISVIGVFTGLTQGILVTGCAVYANQLIKQANKID